MSCCIILKLILLPCNSTLKYTNNTAVLYILHGSTIGEDADFIPGICSFNVSLLALHYAIMYMCKGVLVLKCVIWKRQLQADFSDDSQSLVLA